MTIITFFLQKHNTSSAYMKDFQRFLRMQDEVVTLHFNIDESKGDLVFANVSNADVMNIVFECIDIVKSM